MIGERAATTSTTFAAIGTTVEVVCTAARETEPAVAVVRARLAELDRAASRFRADSELVRINTRSAALANTEPDAQLRVPVSRTLGNCLRAAIRAQRLTDGLVSASLGTALAACGYDDDLDVVRERAQSQSPISARPRPGPCPAADFDEQHWQLVLPAGAALDLGASAKAWAADAIAQELDAMFPGGFLVNLGGDIATAGTPPDGGWSIGVRDWNHSVVQVIRSTGQAFATSSTRLRTWVRHGTRHHHIIDPRTGWPARTRWAQVSCAGPDAVQANAASTAAIILDDRAPYWLTVRGVPARLADAGGRVTVTPGWPAASGAQER